jgi:hypothetical protein
MNASDYAAWWGAGVATLALTWNIYRALRSGPRVKVTATPDIQVFPRTAITGDTVYISVTATNRGTAPTTLTNFVGFHEKTLLDLFLRRLLRRRKGFVVFTGPLGQPIPYVLKPGEQWSNVVEQLDLQSHYQGGYLYIGVSHNQRKRPIYAHVHLPPTKPDPPDPSRGDT